MFHTRRFLSTIFPRPFFALISSSLIGRCWVDRNYFVETVLTCISSSGIEYIFQAKSAMRMILRVIVSFSCTKFLKLDWFATEEHGVEGSPIFKAPWQMPLGDL